MELANKIVFEASQLDALIRALANGGYRVVGPTVRDGAVVYEELSSSCDLPVGWTDEQDGGFYRLKRRSDGAFFGYVLGPHSWKKFLLPPTRQLLEVTQSADGFQQVSPKEPPPKVAFFGARACELAAIAVQDKVLMGGRYVDSAYQENRANVFIVAVNCSGAGATCFCVSMKTGPKAAKGFDLALTEVLDGSDHYFLVEIGTEKGAEILQGISTSPANGVQVEKAQEVVARTATQMRRSLDTTDIKDLFYRNYDNPQWNEVAKRCLSCANCTMVCPTCFCTTVEDAADLTGRTARRRLRWDSCFTMGFSYIHGGSVRSSPKSRYRQWLTHKLATWIDQFGCSGCVGCGRCIAWCPVGIDLTQEARVLRESEQKKENSYGKTYP